MTIERAGQLAAFALLTACSQHHTAEAPPRTRQQASDSANARLLMNVHRLQQLLNQARSPSTQEGAFGDLPIVGMDDGAVPEFELAAPGGVLYSSKALVGQQAFVTVFFATWCDYCQVELKAMQQAFAKTGPLPVIPVSVDGPDTWQRVPGYLAAFGIHERAVRASDYPRFAASYDPFDTVPLLVIVGRNGGLVDCLVGYDPAHAERLVDSLKLAKMVGPLARPQTSASTSIY
jgi:thiol-disulfide isomerase/thioredoxin